MRRLLGTVLVALALAASLIVLVMAWAGRNVTEPGRFADTVVRTLRSDPAAGEVGDLVVARVDLLAARRGVAVPGGTRDLIRNGVATALRSEGFARAARPALERAHDETMRRPDGVTVDLRVLRERVVAAADPSTAALIPPAEQFPTLVVPFPDGARTVVRLVKAAGEAWPLAIVAALICVAAAVLVTGDRSGPLRSVGVGLMVLGALPPVLRLVTPPLSEGVAPPATDGTAAELARQLTRGWLVAGAWTAVLGLVLIVVASFVRPRSRRRTARRR